MVLPRVARLLAALFVLALPASAGTLYVPILEPDGTPGADYQTRIWLTNHAGQAVTVTTVRMHSVVDGTTTRDAPRKHRIAAGATKVLTPGRDAGLLEIQAPPSVAVEAEIRNLSLPARQEVFADVPVIGSAESAPAGGRVVLQGLRRTPLGVRTLLGLVNLGHQPALCEVRLDSASGARLGSATNLPLPPLSHLPIADVLELLDVAEMADANATVSCSQRFYAYLTITSTATGGTVFVEPSATGASTLQPPEANSGGGGNDGGNGGGGSTSGGKAVVYQRSGLVHRPTQAHPTWTHDIQTPPNTDFGKVVVELDVTVGKWDAQEPNKSHSIFWLHRGGKWPKWANNMIGFANAHGPGANTIKIAHNMNVSAKEKKKPKLIGRVPWQRGETYHVRYVYDAAGNRITMQVSRGGKVVASASSKARVRRIRSDGSGEFMLYFGHTRYTGRGQGGPEKPTYGWRYSNVRVEFHPL